MSSLCRSAFYGKGKKLRDESWRAVGADINRRVDCGDLDAELRFLSFANRKLTADGWQVLEQTLSKITSCWTLDLQHCGINDVAKLTRLLPKLSYMCKRVDVSGNRLSAKSVSKLVDAMAKTFAHKRPVWLCIGDDAAADVPMFCSQCHPYHEKGCLCARQSAVHVVRKLDKYNAADKARWEEENLRPLECYVICSKDKRSKMPAQLPKHDSAEDWPTLVPAPQPDSAPHTASDSTRDNDKADGCSQETVDDEDSDRSCSPHLQDATVSPFSVFTAASEQALAVDIQDTFASYFRCERRAHEMEVMRSLAEIGKISPAPLEAAARFTRQRAAGALVELRANCNSLTCVLVGERMLMLAAGADASLLFIDLTESVSRGTMVDVQGAPACRARPVYAFTFRVKALPFQEACVDQHQLRATGGETLEICLEHKNFLLSGWVAARVHSEATFLWFPIERCCAEDK